MCTKVSPESDAGIDLLENVQSSIADALKNSFPGLVEAVSVNFKATLEFVKQAVSVIEYEILQRVWREFSDEVEKFDVKALSYNRCVNVRFPVVDEKPLHDGKLIPKRTEITMRTVLKVLRSSEAGLQLIELSITHLNSFQSWKTKTTLTYHRMKLLKNSICT